MKQPYVPWVSRIPHSFYSLLGEWKRIYLVPGEVEGNTGLDYGAGSGNIKEKTEVREAGNENMLRTHLLSKSQEQRRQIFQW